MIEGRLKPELGLPTLVILTCTELIMFCNLAVRDYHHTIQACLPPWQYITVFLQSIKDRCSRCAITSGWLLRLWSL